ncbi:uncharacterized protein LOC144987453 [Oryzias latipes]
MVLRGGSSVGGGRGQREPWCQPPSCQKHNKIHGRYLQTSIPVWTRMWTFLIIAGLLDLSRTAAVTGRPSSPQVFLHLDQVDASTVSPALDTPQQMASSSSSSSSSSSESSQSSEGFEPQQQLEPQNPENTALEQLDSSEESSELRPPPSLRHHQLVSLGEGGDTEGGGAQKHQESTELGGANTYVGVENDLGGVAADEGVASQEKLLDDSREDHLHLHDYHHEEAGLELAL